MKQVADVELGPSLDANTSFEHPATLHAVPPLEVEEDIRQVLADKYEPVPDELRPHEFGFHNFVALRLGQIIMLGQQRGEHNPVEERIARSIEAQGLLNLPVVARMPYEAAKEYIEFTNQIWRSNFSIEDFEPDADGCYNIVIAGHTRTRSMTSLALKRSKLAAQAGYEVDWRDTLLQVQARDALSPEELMGIQLAENTYSAPTPERTAMGIVEMYQYGLSKGHWKTKVDYLRALDGKFTAKNLNDALEYQKLHDPARALVENGSVKYSQAIELAKVLDTYWLYKSLKLFKHTDIEALTDDQYDLLQVEVDDFIMHQMSQLDVQRKGLKVVQEYFANLKKSWLGSLAAAALPDEPSFEDMLDSDFMVDPVKEAQIRQKNLRRKTKDNTAVIGSRAIRARAAVAIHAAELGDGELVAELSEGLVGEAKAATRQAARLVAQFAVNDAQASLL